MGKHNKHTFQTIRILAVAFWHGLEIKFFVFSIGFDTFDGSEIKRFMFLCFSICFVTFDGLEIMFFMFLMLFHWFCNIRWFGNYGFYVFYAFPLVL